MVLLLSEESTNYKTRNIALAFALKIEMADGSRRESTCCLTTDVGVTL